MSALVDALAALLLVAGAVFALGGSIALARLSTFEKRLHGPSKAGTMGVGCALLASLVVAAWRGDGAGHELLALAFLFATAPAAAMLLLQAVDRRR
jgi:multicomponent K+:H+ antiporter subunit G